MRIDPKYQIREMAGEHVIVLPGRLGADMTRIISLNTSSMLLWDELHERDFTAEDAARVLVEHYEIDEQTALRDARLWCENLAKNNLAK